MTYPQPSTGVQIAQGGLSQWRLLTQVAGPGEIYEIDNSCSAIALGPESDFASVAVTYLDPSLPPTLVSTIRVTPQFMAPLQVTPRQDTTYPVSPGRKGRMLAWLIDNYNIGYIPVGFDVTKMFQYFVPPTLDLVGWQQQPPLSPTRRGDKEWLYETHQATTTGGGNGGIWRIFPTFGRKYIFIDLFNNSGVALQNYEVRGVNFSTVSNPNPLGPGPRDDSETILVAPGAVGNGSGNKKVVSASSLGMFDAIAIFIDKANGGTISNCPLRVKASDDPI